MGHKTVLAVIALLGLLPAAAGAREVRETQDFTVPADQVNTLMVTTPAGNITIEPAAGNQLHIHAVKRAQDDDGDGRRALAGIEVRQHRKGDRLAVDATWPHDDGDRQRSRSVSFTITCPTGLRVETQSGAGNLEVTGVAEAQARTGAGNVTLSTIRGAVEAHTGAGNLELDRCAGPARLETGAGNIQLRRGPGRVTAHTGAGNVDGDLAATPEQADLGTAMGNIALRLPERASAHLVADTPMGRVHVPGQENQNRNGMGAHVDTNLGEGKGSVRLRTAMGNIDVTQAGG